MLSPAHTQHRLVDKSFKIPKSQKIKPDHLIPVRAIKTSQGPNTTKWFSENIKTGSLVSLPEPVSNLEFQKQSRNFTPRIQYRPETVPLPAEPSSKPLTNLSEYHFTMALASELVSMSQVDIRKALRFKDHEMFSSTLPYHPSQAQVLMYHHVMSASNPSKIQSSQQKKTLPRTLHKKKKDTKSIVDINVQASTETLKEPLDISRTALPTLPCLPINLRSYSSQASARVNLCQKTKEAMIVDARELGKLQGQLIKPNKELLKIVSVLENAK